MADLTPEQWQQLAGAAPTEPDAQSRIFARNVRQQFLALTAEGFTEQQALALCAQVITAAIIGGMQQ